MTRREEAKLLLANRLDFQRDRGDDGVGEKNAGERAHERGADQPAERLRRLVQGAHRVDDAEHGGDDAQRGKAVRDRLERVNRLVAIMGERLDLLVHQRLDFVGLGVADDDQPAVVADEREQIVVGEQPRKSLEDFRFRGIVEMPFDFAARLAAQFAHQGVHRAQDVEEVARLGHLVGHRLERRPCRSP